MDANPACVNVISVLLGPLVWCLKAAVERSCICSKTNARLFITIRLSRASAESCCGIVAFGNSKGETEPGDVFRVRAREIALAVETQC